MRHFESDMICKQCGQENPRGQNFCGNCGAALNPDLVVPQAQVQFYLEQHLPRVLRESLKDRNVVEIETAEAILNRLFRWLKYTGFVLGVPIFVLGVFGLKNYLDLSKSVSAAKTQAEQLLVEAQRLEVGYGKLDQELIKFQIVAKNFTELQSKVGRLEFEYNLSLEEVKHIQQALGVEAYGFLDQSTRQAIAEWQRERGFTATGKLSPDITDKILKER